MQFKYKNKSDLKQIQKPRQTDRAINCSIIQ